MTFASISSAYSPLPPSPKGGDLTLGPGKGIGDGNDGKVRIQDADCNDLIVIDATSLSILGKRFDLQRVADALESFIDNDACNCPMGTLVSRGCQCGGN
jgi:hypothetical protein